MRFATESGVSRSRGEAGNGVPRSSAVLPARVDRGVRALLLHGRRDQRYHRYRKRVRNRGIVSREGAGKHIGGGTRVYDVSGASGIPAVVMPGLHRGLTHRPPVQGLLPPDQPREDRDRVRRRPRSTAPTSWSPTSRRTRSRSSFATGASRVPSTPASLRPGTLHGALDVDAIRRMDAGEWTANEAFHHAGVEFTHARGGAPPDDRDVCCDGVRCPAPARARGDGRARRDRSRRLSRTRWRALLGRPVAVRDEWAAASGLVRIARDVFGGADDILGIPVDR